MKKGRSRRRLRSADRHKTIRFRRHATLVLYWRGKQLVFENYAQRAKISADPLTCSILDYCGEWRSAAEVCAFLSGYSEASVGKNLNLLCESGVLERSDAKADARQTAMEAWASWNPAAGFFHFSTKDTEFTPDPMSALRALAKRAKHHPMPLPVKNYPRAPKTRLPRVKSEGEFATVLKDRRTWRLYGKGAVPLEALAKTLELAFGIQGWVNVPGLGRAAMKTSPSCGCLHPLEAYVVAQRVEGLRKGMYHYTAARHELEWLRVGVTTKELEKSLGNQWWFAKGAFLVVMTAVFDRTRWKYDFPRVYRGILMEAGHACQTFCLTATWLGLAPFCTIAQTDTQWEKWLGIDGVRESVLYVAGAGTRPEETRDAHMGTMGR